jgi:hypothetical protein
MSGAIAVAIVGQISRARDPVFLQDFSTLRQITTSSKLAFITDIFGATPSSTITGWFMLDDNDTATLDDGVNTIVSATGKRWKRLNTNIAMIVTYTAQAQASAAGALASQTAAGVSATAAAASQVAAAASAAAAAASATNLFSVSGLFSTKVAGLLAVAGNQYFGLKQVYGGGVEIYQDVAGVAVYAGTNAFGVGTFAAQVKALELATIEDWPVAPDILIDSLDQFLYDGKMIPNSVKMLTNPPNKNLIATAVGDIYFSTSGTPPPSLYVRRVTGTGGQATAVEWQFTGTNVNVDFIPVINNHVFDPGTYKAVVSIRSKAGFGAQNIQWFESWGGTSRIDAIADAPFADTATFTFTVAARAAGSLRLRSQVLNSTFQMDRVRVFEDDGLAMPAWSDDSAGNHLRNRACARGGLLSNGLFIDTVNSALSSSVPLAANGLPVAINDITAFVSFRATATPIPIIPTANFVTSSAADGSSPVAYMLGMYSPVLEGPETSGALRSTPTPLETHNLVVKNEGFHVAGTSLSNETVYKALDGLIYWDHARSGGAPALAVTPSRLGVLGSENIPGPRGDIAQVAIWINRGVAGSKPFTSTQIKAIMAKMKKHVIARGGSMASFRDILYSEGDSRNNYNGVDPNGPGWNFQVGAADFFGTNLPSLKVPQVGWSSSLLGTPSDVEPAATDINWVGSTLWSRKTRMLALITAAHELGLRIFFTWMNDINDTVRIPANAAQYSTDEKVLMQIYRDALDAGGLGSKFFLFTCTPVHTNAAFEPGRATLNTLRRAYPASLVHGIIDIAADATLGTYSGTTAPAGYVDNLHFNKAGATIVANLVKPAISPYRLY